jgi:hypothetical protein
MSSNQTREEIMTEDKPARGKLPKFKTPATKTSTKILRPDDLIRSSQFLETIQVENTNE